MSKLKIVKKKEKSFGIKVGLLLNQNFKNGLDKIGFCKSFFPNQLQEFSDFYSRVEKTWLEYNKKRNDVIEKYVQKEKIDGKTVWKEEKGRLVFGKNETAFNEEIGKLFNEIAIIEGEKAFYNINCAEINPIEYYFMKDVLTVD